MSILQAKLLKLVSDASGVNTISNTVCAVSSNDDVYIAGLFTGILDIGNGIQSITTTSTNGSGFLAKYDSSLNPVDLKYLGGTNAEDSVTILGLVISSSGDIYTYGKVKGTLNIGIQVQTATSTTTNYWGFLAKYGSGLTPVSLVDFISPNPNDTSSISFISFSPSGDIYVTGRFYGTLSIGGGIADIYNVNTGQKARCFIAKYTSNLTPTALNYLISTNETDESGTNSLAISSNGDVYVCGYFTGILDIGNGIQNITTKSTTGGGFLAKYTSSLIPVALKYLGGTNDTDKSTVSSLAVSSNGAVYVSGSFRGMLDIGNGIQTITTTSTQQEGFVAKYTSSLNQIALRYLGGTNKNDLVLGTGLGISTNGNVYVFTSSIGMLDIGGGIPHTRSTNLQSNIAKYKSDLTPSSLDYLTATPVNIISGYAISPSGYIYIIGSFVNKLQIGSGIPAIYTSDLNIHGFIAKYLIYFPTKVTGVKIAPTSTTINTSVTKKFVATIIPSNAYNKKVTWKSSNTKIATVTKDGIVKGISPGKVTIKVTSLDGSYTANSIVTILKKVTGIKLNIPKATIKLKTKKQLKAIIAPANASNKKVTWKSSNTKVATVNSNGLVTGVGIGKASIKCTAVDGSKKLAVSTITVTN
jgi:uncharacterized protein YjdB